MLSPLLETTAGISLLWSTPFALLLASIALMPFLAKHWWEKHYPKVAIGLGLIPTIYYFVIVRMPHAWLMSMEEYISFILLLAALYIISGGIVIRVNRKATPLANCTLLAIGAVLANIFGTTGASMLLIRPYLHMNRGHVRPFHVVFFLFIVSNCGGMLTPIGDPPLFLGYLNGIPFSWTIEHLWPLWLLANGALLALFFVFDTVQQRKEVRVAHTHDVGPQVHILGIHNLLFIALVLLGVFRPSIFEAIGNLRETGRHVTGVLAVIFSRELLMVAATVLSLGITRKDIYRHNQFSYGPIKEVAIIFVGIFSTMAPALGYLESNAEKLRIHTPGQFYYACGSLSSCLDNAPTYLAFLKLRLGEIPPDEARQAQEAIATLGGDQPGLRKPIDNERVRNAVETTIAYHADLIHSGKITTDQVKVGFLVGNPSLNAFLIAISAGAVLFGACTYIGNGPNFMVKSIAESAGCRMPGFIGYICCYTLPILLPLYVLIWYVFLY